MQRAPKELKELALPYLQDLLDTLKALSIKISSLETDLDRAATLSDIKAKSHRIKGSGGSYGYPSITAIAGQIEALSASALAQSPTSTPNEYQELKARIDDLLAEVAIQLKALQNDPPRPNTLTTQTIEAPNQLENAELSLDNIQILVVDEDRQISNLVERVLTRNRKTLLRICETTVEAEKILNESRPDLVLLSVSLPQTSAYNFAKLIRSKASTQQIPIIFLSADTELLNIVDSIRAGADDILIKPFDAQSLLDKVNEIIATARPKHLRIAMVDDDPDLHRIVEQAVGPMGFHLYPLENPSDTIQMLSKIMPDLLLLDIDMPDMNGVEVCRAIRTDVRFKALPIIFLSSNSDEETAVRGFRAGADDYITKPFRVNELVARIQSRVQRNDILSEQAHRDGLTQLYHNQYFHKYLNDTITEAQRYKDSFCLVMLDIDNFKDVNDLHGHLTGDRLIQELAKFLQLRLRHSDVIARYGGDEFAVLLRRISPYDCKSLFTLLKDDFMSRKFNSMQSAKILQITLSIGISVFPHDGFTKDDLIKAADNALYQSKLAGKNSVTISHTSDPNSKDR